eukprot:CAMPEP_0194222828 /NCGR_PEP_ID=MMETSP0156-20130528/33852_1 /TAXON_ID=33649 /ORGANISM="Thalassionema nitzschioides, Strain L26-B" /LENGTH=244 /DNA_ID=CAMNT_0038953771 /DNA_START=160 /DNA_END=894 /DNA_ORIENTATION=+
MMSKIKIRAVIMMMLLTGLTAFISPIRSIQQRQMMITTKMYVVSLKPAATPLMDSGKAFARSGELLIEVTSKLDLYGGALSAAGALIRNSGDCIAQAAASCRFKTALELVCDELREAANCLDEATSKLDLAAKEATNDQNAVLGKLLEDSIPVMGDMASALEAAGSAILQRKTEKEVGENLLQCSEYIDNFSARVKSYAPELKESSDAGQRMAFAAACMRSAASKLTEDPPKSKKAKGKSWIKG